MCACVHVRIDSLACVGVNAGGCEETGPSIGAVRGISLAGARIGRRPGGSSTHGLIC